MCLMSKFLSLSRLLFLKSITTYLKNEIKVCAKEETKHDDGVEFSWRALHE